MTDASMGHDQRRTVDGRALVSAEPGALAQPRRDPYELLGYGAPLDDDGSISTMVRQYFHLFLKRKWMILGATLAVTVLGGVLSLLKTPLYMATVRIQIDREPAKIMDGGVQTSSEADYASDFLRTQLELLKSRSLAERAVSSLHLGEDKGFFAPREVSLLSLLSGSRKAEPSSLAARQGMAGAIVLSNLTLAPVQGSRLVDLSYVDPNPDRAQQVANGYAEAYIASNLDKRFEANSYAKAFLDDQIKQLKIRLEESEKALLDFAEREKMVEVTDKASITENNLAAANAALGALISERIKNEQMWRQVEHATGINLPQLLSNNVIELLRGQRKALETEYKEKLENFKPSYPAMMQITGKIKEIDRQLDAEVKIIRNSLKAAYESSLAQENEMKSRIEALKAEMFDLQKKGIQYNILKREVETNRGLYNNVLQRYKEVDVAGGAGTNNVFIVDRAEPPGAPFQPNIPRSLLLSLAVGLGAGGGLAFVLELLDDRVRAPDELEQLSGLTMLGIIPSAGSEEQAPDALKDPRSALSEAYRSLAIALQFSTESGLPRSIVVTSGGPGEGKSTTSIAIAYYFSQMGLRVLLIDADLRKPSLHTRLRLANDKGLSNYLTGAALPPEVVQKTDHPNLAFMGSGPLPPNAADLLAGTKIFSLISVGSEVFDLIIFDSPPLLGLADAQLLASAAAATIFVVGAGQSGKGMIRSALRRLQLARVSPIGAVLTKFDPAAVSFGYAYGNSYGDHSYSYQAYGYGDGYRQGNAVAGSEINKQIPSGAEKR